MLPGAVKLSPRTATRLFEPGALEAAQCHAATLLPTPGGGLLCAFFAGTREGHGDVSVWWAERRDGIWSAPDRLPQVARAPHWNPVLFEAEGRAHLCFKVGPSPRDWRTWRRTRPLAGGEWSAAGELVPGDPTGRGPVKNKPIRLSDGALLAPASTETWRRWDCFVDRSEDGGRTWRRSERVPLSLRARRGRGIIQPALWESEPGRVHLLARSTCGRIVRAESRDGGRTFSRARPTALPNNDSGIDLVKLRSGGIVLAYNPVSVRKVRTPLHLAVSADGERFEDAAVLASGPGEYSYPAIVEIPGGVAVAYTFDRVSMAVCELDARP